MRTYVRPAVEDPVFRDAAGTVITYGDRWGLQGPPQDTYSVTTRPERFQPLHEVADALIAHLVASYDVEVTTGAAVPGGEAREGPEVVRTTELRPRDSRAAPLTVAHTASPGVVAHTGVLLDSTYPVCGCDACDDTWQSRATDLVRRVRRRHAACRSAPEGGRRPAGFPHRVGGVAAPCERVTCRSRLR